MPPHSKQNLNPIADAHASSEVARAKELATQVQKSLLGSHTEHTFEQHPTQPQENSQAPKTEIPPEATTQSAKLTGEAQRILQSAMLIHEPAQPTSLPNLTPAEHNTPKKDERPSERIHENQSLTSQSAVLHTLSQDVQTLVKDRKVSMVRAVALEGDTNPHIAQFSQKETRGTSTNKVLIALAAVCGIFACGILGAALYVRSIHTATQQQEIPQARYDSSLIFFEHTQPFDVTGLTNYELLGNLAHLRDSIPSSLGSMTVIDMYATQEDTATKTKKQTLVPLEAFVSQAHLEMPSDLDRSLSGEYMILVHQGEAPTPVILLKTSDSVGAFAGMLQWEKRVASNLSPFFPLGTLTLAETNPTFADMSINNIDARVLYDGDTHVVMVYALLEKNILAITNAISTLQEVATRLHTQRLKQ